MEEKDQPVTLDYFAPHEPQRRKSRGVVIWSVVLLVSWGPYLCGIVNASTVSRAYVPEIKSAHLHATVIGFVVALTLSGGSLLWFARKRHLPGTIAAGG